jgi:hypothetical protein
MKKLLVVSVILVCSVAFGQSKIIAVQPALLPSALTDYGSKKAMVISKEGTYVCSDGYDLYVNVPEPKVKDAKIPQGDHKNILYVPDGARLINSDKSPYIPICIAIK